MIDQLVPFQCSTNVLKAEFVKSWPTARQVVVLGQDTPRSRLSDAPLGLGLLVVVQLVPFQRSTNVLIVLVVESLPTARQLVVVGQDTPLRLLSVLGFGLVMIDQLVPFQRSTNVLVALVVEESPTATQLVVLGQDTPERMLVSALVLGLVMIDQLVPFQCCTKVLKADEFVME
jgi:hypothetical protein